MNSFILYILAKLKSISWNNDIVCVSRLRIDHEYALWILTDMKVFWSAPSHNVYQKWILIVPSASVTLHIAVSLETIEVLQNASHAVLPGIQLSTRIFFRKVSKVKGGKVEMGMGYNVPSTIRHCFASSNSQETCYRYVMMHKRRTNRKRHEPGCMHLRKCISDVKTTKVSYVNHWISGCLSKWSS